MNARIRQPGQDRTDKIAGKGQPEQDRKNRTGRNGQAEKACRTRRQNRLGE
jgi:hypothetical protein